MKKIKFYINDENKLNEYEKQHGKISYKTLIDFLFTDIILCNNITHLFYTDINGEYIEPLNEIGTDYEEETEDYKEIYQYFIVDFSSTMLDFMNKYCKNEIILYYIDFLDLYILGVDHLGTSWDYVLTDIEYTTEYKDSMQDLLYK